MPGTTVRERQNPASPAPILPAKVPLPLFSVMDSQTGSQPQESMTIKLTLIYRTPSLNVTKRQHWAVQMKEKHRAFNALASALLATASDPSTPTTLQDRLRTALTVFATARLSKGMNPGGSSSKPRKSKSVRSRKSAR